MYENNNDVQDDDIGLNDSKDAVSNGITVTTENTMSGDKRRTNEQVDKQAYSSYQKYVIALGIALSISLSLFGGLALGIVIYNETDIHQTVMLSYVLGGILGFFIPLLLMAIILGLRKSSSKKKQFMDSDEKREKLWKDCRNNKTPVSGKKLIKKAALIMLILVAVYIVLMVVLYGVFNSLLHNMIVKIDEGIEPEKNLTPIYMGATVVACLPTSTLACFIGVYGIIKNNMCENCGSLYGYELIDTKYMGTRTSTETKSRDIRGTVGTLYADGKKIGDIEGVIGTEVTERNYEYSHEKLTFKCAYCGHIEHDDDVSVRRV